MMMMVIDNNNKRYKKNKLIIEKKIEKEEEKVATKGEEGFIQFEQVVKELNTLLKYYGAENVQPDIKQTQKIFDKFDINKELVETCEI